MVKFRVGDRVRFSTTDHYNNKTGRIAHYYMHQDGLEWHCYVDNDASGRESKPPKEQPVFSSFELVLLKRIKRKVV